MFKIKNFFTALIILLTVHAYGQGQSHKVVVDKILGVVGDRIILNSDITNQLSDIARSGEQAPPNAACEVLENMMLSKILALQAEKDSLPVTDEEVEASLDLRVRNWVSQFGSQEAIEEIVGKSIYQLKDDSRQAIKEQMLASAMQKKIVENVHITPSEVKAFFDRVPTDSLPYLESELEVGQINISPKASRDVEEYIYNEMLNYKKQIETGATTFEALAKKVSEDPGSRERGGLYEVARGDKSMDPVFISTSFRLKTGEISLPVKSNKFGYFLIQSEEKRGDVAKVKMILRIPPVTDGEIEDVKAKLDTVRNEILASKITFKDAAYKYSDDENVKNYGPYVLNADGSTFVTIDKLDRDMVNTIKDMKVGDISKPMAFANEMGKRGARLVYLKSRTEPHIMNLKDDYSKIAEMALAEKKNRELDSWLTKKIPTYYILVDKDAANECPGLNKYQITQNTGF